MPTFYAANALWTLAVNISDCDLFVGRLDFQKMFGLLYSGCSIRNYIEGDDEWISRV